MTTTDVKLLDTIQKLKQGKFKMPAKVGEAIDLLFAIRSIRLDAQKEVDAAQEGETKIGEYIQNTLTAAGLESGRGEAATFTKTQRIVYKIVDFDKTKAWLKKTGRFEILQQRPTSSVVEEYFADGKPIPGIDKMVIPAYSLTKVSR